MEAIYANKSDNRSVDTASRRTRLYAALSGLILGIAGLSVAQASTTAHVVYCGVNGAGTMFIYLDQAVSGPACSSQEVRVASTHPQFKSILALAAAAAASGATVTVATDLCTGSGNPQISETTTSFFLVNAN